MAHTGIVIAKESWDVLREEPLYSARFIHREGSDELALVVRVEELDGFLQNYPPLTLALTSWCSPQGTWVVAVAYQLHPLYGGGKGGIFFFNPRQRADMDILHKLLQRDSLPTIFLNDDCTEHYSVGVVLPPQEVERWRQAILVLAQTLPEKTFSGEEDPAFELARRAFQERSAQEDLFAGGFRS
jgi:hypothetical protein